MPIVVIASRVEGHAPPPASVVRAGRAFRAAGLAYAAGRPDDASRMLAGVVELLDRLSGPASVVQRDLLDRAADEHRQVCEAEMPDMPDAAFIYDEYFEFARIPRADSAEQAMAAIAALFPLARFLAPAPLPLDDKAKLAWFSAALLAGEAAVDAEPADPAEDGPDARVWLHPLERWRLGHALYGLANRAAGATISEAAGLYELDPDAAASKLRRAAELVETFTSAMELAASMSGDEYSEQVRPTMVPPALALALTGTQNADHATFRRSIAALLAELDQPFAELVRQHRPLAEARDRLLQADLIDLERHTVMTYRLVGSLPALDEDPGGSAVQALRALRTRRQAAYSELTRHGWMTADALANHS